MKNNTICPDCKQPLTNFKVCECGWRLTEKNKEVQSNKNCAYEGAGNRCPLFGSRASSRCTKGVWYCSGHYEHLDDPEKCEEILKFALENHEKFKANLPNSLFLNDLKIIKSRRRNNE